MILCESCMEKRNLQNHLQSVKGFLTPAACNDCKKMLQPTEIQQFYGNPGPKPEPKP